MAFVSVTGSTFLGQRAKPTNNVLPLSSTRPSPTTTAPSMKFGTEQMLSKYEEMASTGPFGTAPKPVVASKPSSVWMTYAQTILDKTAPTRRVMFAPETSFEDMMNRLALSSFLFTAPGGSPTASKADSYMAKCATAQYKMSACPTGVYNVQCTEGTTKFQAEDSRTVALGAAFRLSQRSSSAKFGDMYELRRRSVIQANMCNYEEQLSVKFPVSSRAVVTGYSEKNTLCVRYATGNSEAEKYMVGCVDKQMKMRAAVGGLYDVLCQDGAAKGLPEFKRVSGMSAKFRAGQMSKIAKEAAKFEAARYARSQYAHLCSYEENLFNKFPAVAAAMRPTSARY